MGSGIAVGDGGIRKLFLTAKRSFRSVFPWWSASPYIESEPKCTTTRMRSCWSTMPSRFASPILCFEMILIEPFVIVGLKVFPNSVIKFESVPSCVSFRRRSNC